MNYKWRRVWCLLCSGNENIHFQVQFKNKRSATNYLNYQVEFIKLWLGSHGTVICKRLKQFTPHSRKHFYRDLEKKSNLGPPFSVHRHRWEDPFKYGFVAKHILMNYSDLTFEMWEQEESLANWCYILNLIINQFGGITNNAWEAG